MTVRWETTQSGGSTMRMYMGVPHRKGPLPAILVAHHAGGVDAQMQDTVHRLFRQGYVVAAPDLYHRQAQDVDPKKRPSLLIGGEILADLNETIAHIKKLEVPVGPIGIVGYCLGGRVSYLAATAISELKAAAVFYGGNMFSTVGDGPSPFDRTASIQCPIIAFTGADDTNPSPEDMRKIDAELTRLNKPHEFHLYRDTAHAFHNFMEDRYRERAARSSWASVLAFLTEHLKRAS
jgi:carboxymethylenebutenolidase